MLTEGQKMMADNSYVVTSRKLPSAVGNVDLKFIDPATALDSQDKWRKNFDEIILKKAR
jgi:hypothetical protein